jgi:hypothetical protein
MAGRDHRAEESEYRAVLHAGIFPPESNAARFLGFVCERYFQGVTTLTEYSIAVDGLGRRPDFDAKQDAIVRVEAHRVRKRLCEYYAKEGSAHPLRLDIPSGQYLPVFVGQEADKTREPAAAPPSGKHGIRARIAAARSGRGLLYVAGAVLVLLAGALIYIRPSAPAVPSAASARAPVTPAPADGSKIRIMAGSSAADYTDKLGQVWSRDRFFTDGERWAARYRRILRTGDPQLFLTSRQATSFGYDIPLKPGYYDLRLYFAETYYGEDNSEGGGESSRVFTVSANGATLLAEFDALADAGGSNIADVRVFKGITPAADGMLHLRFKPQFTLKAIPFVNAIEILPGKRNAMLPIRWVASDTAVLDSQNRTWQPDQFCHGGRLRVDTEVIAGTPDPSIYRCERYGNFSYAVPVADGTYSLTLHFTEHWFGVENRAGGYPAGARLFDVYCNGTALLHAFDIGKSAGGSLIALQRTFHGLKPNAQGKLLLSFVPIRDYATLAALEVVDESDR